MSQQDSSSSRSLALCPLQMRRTVCLNGSHCVTTMERWATLLHRATATKEQHHKGRRLRDSHRQGLPGRRSERLLTREPLPREQRLTIRERDGLERDRLQCLEPVFPLTIPLIHHRLRPSPRLARGFLLRFNLRPGALPRKSRRRRSRTEDFFNMPDSKPHG